MNTFGHTVILVKFSVYIALAARTSSIFLNQWKEKIKVLIQQLRKCESGWKGEREKVQNAFTTKNHKVKLLLKTYEIPNERTLQFQLMKESENIWDGATCFYKLCIANIYIPVDLH